MNPLLFDTHCHLQDAALVRDHDGVMRRAAEAGVCRFLCCASAEGDWDAVADLVARHPDITPAFGLHPWQLEERQDGWLERLAARLQGNSAAAIGEIGLDSALPRLDAATQEEVFLAQLELSCRARRPVSIHCCRAWHRLPALLRRQGPHPAGIVFHSYSGGVELVTPLAELNGYFSFSATVLHPRNTRARRAAQAVPLDRLLIESDAPNLPPETAAPELLPLRDANGRPVNEPAALILVAQGLADLRGIPLDELCQSTWQNARRLFDRGEP